MILTVPPASHTSASDVGLPPCHPADKAFRWPLTGGQPDLPLGLRIGSTYASSSSSTIQPSKVT
jgi:hypothetical protein